MRAVLLLATTVPIIAACGDDIVLEGEHFRYVISDLKVPSNNTEARESALDLNNDELVDNQLGMVFGTLNGQGLGVGGTAHESLLRGGLIMLADLQTTSFEDSGLSGFSMFLGSDPDPAPCVDPDDLATCGKHLLGTAHFTVDANSASGLAVAPIRDRRFIAAIGTLPVELVIDEAPLRLDLQHAHVRLAEITEDRIVAVLGGGITASDVQSIVIPEAAAQIARIVATECGQPTGVAPCGCVDNSRAEDLVDLFDVDHDCSVSLTEVAENSLVQSLASTDLRFGDDTFLSIGVRVELVKATFTP